MSSGTPHTQKETAGGVFQGLESSSAMTNTCWKTSGGAQRPQDTQNGASHPPSTACSPTSRVQDSCKQWRGTLSSEPEIFGGAYSPLAPKGAELCIFLHQHQIVTVVQLVLGVRPRLMLGQHDAEGRVLVTEVNLKNSHSIVTAHCYYCNHSNAHQHIMSSFQQQRLCRDKS